MRKNKRAWWRANNKAEQTWPRGGIMTQKDQSYQELKEQLDSILSQLQHEDTDIDKAVELHKNGQQILKELETYLGEVIKNTDVKIKISKG
jgi:exodeoxyribonuclease VII small subunit